MERLNIGFRSDSPRNYRRRLEHAKRARDKKRAKIERALLAGGWIKQDGIWIGKDWSLKMTGAGG